MVADLACETFTEVTAEALGAGLTLPADWYTSPVVLQREKERIFHRFWHYVGYAEQVSRPGDAFRHELGGLPIVVERGVDNSLVARTTSSDRDGAPVRVRQWGPMLFACADPAAPDLFTQLGELPAIVASTGVDLASLRLWRRSTYDIAANWKVVVENYNECYHCPIAHPSFADLFDMDTYKVVTEYRYFSVQHGTVTDSFRQGAESGYFDVREEVLAAGIRDGMSAFVWPASTIDITPGQNNLVVGMVLPVDQHRTLQIYDSFFSPDADLEQAEGMRQFGEQVQSEDIVLCESVQRGLRSGFYTQGRLMVTRENGIQHFQRLVHQAIGS